MCNIRKELQFSMINFLSLRLFHLTQMKCITQTDTVANNPENITGNTNKY